MNARGPSVAAAAVALVAAASASAGSGPDKAGGRATALEAGRQAGHARRWRPATAPSATEYAAAVARLSGGTIRIDVQVGRRCCKPTTSAFTVEDVRRREGASSAASAPASGTRWARRACGLSSRRFSSTASRSQRRVLESPLAARMLAGLDRAGVVGLALRPARCAGRSGCRGRSSGRRTTGGRRSGSGSAASRGRPSRRSARRSRATRAAQLPQFDGAELDLKTIADSGLRRAREELTANVVLWAATADGRRQPRRVRAADSLAAGGPAAGRSGSHRRRGCARREGAAATRSSASAPAAPTCSRRHPPTELAALRRRRAPVYADARPRSADEAADRARSGSCAGPTPQRAGAAAARARPTRLALEGRWESTVEPRRDASPTARRRRGGDLFSGDGGTLELHRQDAGASAVSAPRHRHVLRSRRRRALRHAMIARARRTRASPGRRPSTRGASTATRCRSAPRLGLRVRGRRHRDLAKPRSRRSASARAASSAATGASGAGARPAHDSRRPPSASTRSARPRKPGAANGHRAADAVVGDHRRATVALGAPPRSSPRRPACLAALVSASEQTKKSAASTGVRQPPDSPGHVDRKRPSAAASSVSAGMSPLLGQRRRMHARARTRRARAERLASSRSSRRDRVASPAARDACIGEERRDGLEAPRRAESELVLRAGAAARRRPRRSGAATPRARRARERASACSRAFATASRAAAATDSTSAPVGEKRVVVDEHREPLAAVVDRRHRPARAWRRKLDRAPGVVDERAGSRKRVADDERRVAERARERGAERPGLARRRRGRRRGP